MKKLTAVILFICAAMAANAQDLGTFTFDGFIRTGFVWTKIERINEDAAELINMGSLDDAGWTDRNRNEGRGSEGRMRMNFSYAIKKVGLKGRLQWDNWTNSAPGWPYLFAYINAFEDQLTVSAGKLGASPWGTGGPEKWKDLETMDAGGGMRFEYKPKFLPGLNAGLVLNWFNGSMDRGLGGRQPTLLDILQETVFGISYEHEYFLVHFEYRLDSDIDQRPGSFASGREGDDLVYRVEERIIRKYLPGFKIWALGVYEGVGAEESAKDCIRFENWFFAEYDRDWGTAQIKLGYDVIEVRNIIYFKPSYYHKFLDNLINVGASFYIANDFGDNRINNDAPFTKLEVEPRLQFNFANAYVAFAYNFRLEYKQPQTGVADPVERYQNINLRVGISF
jgi:hypothetical protein